MSEPIPATTEHHGEDDDAPAPPRAANDQANTAYILLAGMMVFQISYTHVFFGSIVVTVTFHLLNVLLAATVGATVILLYNLFAGRNNWRLLGFVPPFLFVMILLTFVTLLIDSMPAWLYSILGFSIGIVVVSMICYPKHGNTGWKNGIIGIILMLNFAIQNLMMITTIRFRIPEVCYYNGLYTLIVVGIGLTLFSWYRLNRHVYELWVESWARVMYRIRGRGTGMIDTPIAGPLLVIANHACWWDPLFIAGVLPRPITAMMTASFYDIWHLKPFMKYVVRAIRVPEKPVRREAPEILEAIAALDRGECVVIFPEGYLRRKEEVPLRRFGRGAWEILRARPDTPVVAAWIEGAWGSWCSWKNGAPMKNKRIDFRRKIEVGLAAPITVPAGVLENHWATRVFLMNAVSRARTQVGLEPFPEFSVPMKGDAEESPP